MSALPPLRDIDHVHVYVADRDAAERWYSEKLGLSRVEKFLRWAADGGPVFLADRHERVLVAVFERPERPPASTVAFGTDGEAFLGWLGHLDAQGVEVEVMDHELSWSAYFKDPWDNLHEITTYDVDIVRAARGGRS